jgi:hypothetical protein
LGGAAGDRYGPPETAGWLTKQSNEPSNVDDFLWLRFRAQVALSASRRADTSAEANAAVAGVGCACPNRNLNEYDAERRYADCCV